MSLPARLRTAPDGESDALRDAAHDLLRHAVAGNGDAAAACLEQLFQLRGRFQAYPLLREIVHGRQRCVRSGAVHVLGAAPLSPQMARNFEEAVAQCQAFLGLPAPCILLQCQAETRDLHLTMASFPGLATLRLSTLSAGFPDNLRQVQFHEVAHCFLTCGVRLLDEGLAHFFAGRYAGAAIARADTGALPGMRVLLSRAADAMFGESVDSDLQTYLSACQAGADLIATIHERGGADAITGLFAAVSRAGSDLEIVRAVEQASGQIFPPASSAPDLVCEAHADLIARALEATFQAWESNLGSDFDAMLAELGEHDVYAQPALLDSLLGLQLNHALLIVNDGQKVGAEEVARIDLLLKAAEALPPGRLWLWRGMRAVLAICMARPNIIKVAVAGQHAVQAFNKAAQLIPDDPDLLVQHASLLLNAPPDYGGDRDLGVSKLRRAMENPIYRNYARHILLKYGVEVAPEAEVPLSAALVQGEPPAAALVEAPVLIAVRGLHLTISPSFTLAPQDFTIRRGERVAFVGRNGSGKTMLMEALLGLRKAERGSVELHLGARGVEQRQQIGGLLQGADLPGLAKVSEIMALHQVIYTRTEPAVTRALGLGELAGKQWGQLSRGQKQRLMLWLALAHVPQVVFLDEPSLGLDEWFLRSLRGLWASLPITLVLVSHIPADLLEVDRIVCLQDGRIVDQGGLAELIARHVGACKARILQPLTEPLTEQTLQAMRALPLMLRAPLATARGWEITGAPGFEPVFRKFIDLHGIASFSLEASSVEDFLAHLAHH
ncbi:ABC-type multidrug transport system ATPase subunit [Oxalobacteraceae bacterium GrIS 1.11]